jgi:hypothetical protein
MVILLFYLPGEGFFGARLRDRNGKAEFKHLIFWQNALELLRSGED